ncbi:MAG: SDR family oxidoreductase, partial [Solirubrobacterales bacterium]|nr:SDR family oxidoreductase [Solirubrobacterales bacterium]
MARTPRDLHGRVIAITGGARGIGRATAQACVRAGMRVAIGDLDIVAARRTATELADGTIAIELDVSNRASVRSFLDVVEERLGPIDALVNNAGIMHLGLFADEDDASASRQVDINVHGVLNGMKEALPRMTARGRGHVVNIASTAGRGGFAGAATYSGTKHFVIGASEAVRFELRGSGVDISCLMPVLVRTELAAGTSDARFVAKLEPEDVADAVVQTLRVPRFEVFVPRYMTAMMWFAAVLPRAAREALARALKADRVFMDLDAAARRDYELRAARSERG